MRLGKVTKKQFLKTRYSSGKSVASSYFESSDAQFLQSTLTVFFYFSVVSKLMPLGKVVKKQFLNADHSSSKSVVFTRFGSIWRTISTINARIILLVMCRK